MPASVVSITGNRQGTYVLLEAVLPGEAPRHIGVILIDRGHRSRLGEAARAL